MLRTLALARSLMAVVGGRSSIQLQSLIRGGQQRLPKVCLTIINDDRERLGCLDRPDSKLYDGRVNASKLRQLGVQEPFAVGFWYGER